MAIIITIIGFGIMVFLHELGHFLLAKKFGVLVHEFSIGMGPKLCSFGKGETKYSIRLFPLGGFVKLEGEDGGDDEPRSFSKLPPLKRIAILISGATMNILLGWIIFTIINVNTSIMPSVVDSIPPEFALEQKYLQPGDKIIKLNNTTVHTRDDIALFMSRNTGEKIRVSLKRDGKEKNINIKPIKTEYGYLLGVNFKPVKCSVMKGAQYAIYDTIYISKAVLFSLGDIFTGKMSVDSLSGPVEIVSTVDTVTKQQSDNVLMLILWLFAMITVNLGIFNLLPFPALDGGSIIFALYELITRKKVKSEIIGYAGLIGFALLMLVAVYVTIGDIRGLIR